MALQTSASAFRTLLFSFKRAFFSSIDASAKNSGSAFVTVAGVCALLLGGLAPAHAQSPNVKFFAAQSAVPSSNLSYPYRVAVDASGDVYISDTQGNQILKETLANGVYTESVVVSTGLATPYGVAVDGSGNVYIADNGHNRVVKETLSGNSYTQTVVPTSALSYPTGVAVDASGDVYIADTGHGRILIERPSGGSYIETALTYASNFAQITGIAVDSSGNIYVSDIDNNAVYAETYSAGSYTPSTIPTSGLNYPYDLAVDASGNLYICDFTNKRIVLETNNSGSYTQSVEPTAALAGPLGVAIGAGGTLYIADTFGQTIQEVQSSPGNFGAVNVSSPAGPINMLFQFYGGVGTLSLTGTQVLTGGATGLDYTDAGSGSCSTSTPYSPGDFCWVAVDFTPQYPGTRMGAVQLLGASGATLASGYVDGMGNGPQINYQYIPQFFSNDVIRVAGSFSPYDLTNPFAAAVDYSGNVYVVDYNLNAVYKETLSAGTYTQSTIASGLDNPEAVAVDGAGNVYVCDSGNNQILLETNSGGSWVQSAIVTGLNFPTGVAVDASGNVYFSSFSDGAVYEVTQSGGVYSSPTALVTGLLQPRKFALDASGNIYIADTGNSRVVKETLSGGTYTQSVIGSGMHYPYGVAVGADGTVFVADTINSRILAETWSNGSYTQSEFIPGPPAYDLQVDQMGNLIFPDPADATVFFINYAQLPSVSFATTNVGSTSGDSPETVTITNVGNQPLTAIAAGLVVAGPNFVEVAGSGVPEDCGTGFSAAPMAPGASCNLSISFEPQVAGALTSTAVLTDNALNANPSSQTIPLQGTGLQQSQTIIFGSLSNIALGSAPFTLTATASSSLAVSFASTTTPVCTISGTTATLVAVGTCTIQAMQAGNAAYTAAAPVSQSFQVTPQSQTSQTISFGSLSSLVLGSAPFALSATASSGLPVSYASTTSSVCTVSGTTATLVTVGTCTIQATQAGNATYTAATPVSRSFQVTQQSPTSQTITFGALSNLALGSAPVSLSATASSSLAVSYASTTTPVCTVSGTTATLVALGTCTIQATQAGNATYAAATPVSQSFQVEAATFIITPSQTSATVAPGQSAVLTVTVAPQGSYTSPITFSCSELPAEAACSFSPATITPDAKPATTTLTITTAPQSESESALLTPGPLGDRPGPLNAAWLVLPGMLLGMLAIATPKRRKLLNCCLLCLVAGGCVLQSACSGVSSRNSTPAGSYTIKVTGTAGTTQQTVAVTLIVS
jgi:sugar lactone lactonase YvrE